MTDSDILKAGLTAGDTGHDYAIITIVSTSGSAPRKNGKLLVLASGETLGSIGGGEIERAAISHALERIKLGTGDFVDYDLASGSVKMACGGRIALLTEVYPARPKLIICGAGHVGLALAPIARAAGFDIIFFDDRDISSLTCRPDPADRFIHAPDYTAALDAFTQENTELANSAYYVIVTHGHAHDAECLCSILKHGAAYVGMIGSKNKIASVYAVLRSQGFAEEALSSVYAPIGLDTGGETPEEIAVSIAAELLCARYGRCGGHLRDKL